MQTQNQLQPFLLFGLICLLSSAGLAQKKDCKFLKGKNEKGKIIQMVASPAKIGNFYVGKRDEGYFISYSTKAIFLLAGNSDNQTQLRVDSVRFYFDDKNIVTLPAIGYGKIENEVKLKYTFNFVQFEVPLNQNNVTKFLSAKLTDIQVVGEKESGLHDLIVEKNQDKLIQAFTCWQ